VKVKIIILKIFIGFNPAVKARSIPPLITEIPMGTFFLTRNNIKANEIIKPITNI
jgi:hypothetical protein